jgi:predicted anti-sigma-YlaC factor YlaD
VNARSTTIVLIVILLGGCSLKSRAVDTLAEVLGEAESVYLSDEDPELIAEALPFNLKTMETLLESNPNHRGLLLTAAKSFILYTYAFVEPKARQLDYTEFDEAEAIRLRAARLYRRAYRYGLNGLSIDHPEIGARLSVSPEQAAADLTLEDVPFTVWTAAALGGVIGVTKDDPESTADIAVVGAMLERALALDEDFDNGTIHEFMFAYEAGRVGGDLDKARRHYERALALGPGKRPSIWLSWAESVSVAEQDRGEFLALVDQALAFDVSAHPENRLLNILAQRRARWLQDTVDELFLENGI